MVLTSLILASKYYIVTIQPLCSVIVIGNRYRNFLKFQKMGVQKPILFLSTFLMSYLQLNKRKNTSTQELDFIFITRNKHNTTDTFSLDALEPNSNVITNFANP